MKLNWQDWLVGVGLLLNLASRFVTNVLTSSISGLVASANAIEANPTGAAKAASTSYFISVIEFCLIMAFIVAYYIYLRRQAAKKESWQFAYLLFTLFAFILLLFDFINDSSILLGLIIHNGLKAI